jgi:cell division protein FtsB
MTTQPNALRLADYLKDRNRLDLTCDEAADELRRLHAENVALHAQADAMRDNWRDDVADFRLTLERREAHIDALEAVMRQALEALDAYLLGDLTPYDAADIRNALGEALGDKA